MIQTKDLVFLHIHYPNIQIKKNQVTFLVGPSGVGKSTLFKLFNQTKSPTSGQIIYDQSLNQSNPVVLRQMISLVSQDVFLFDDTIENNFHQFYDRRHVTRLTAEAIQKFLDICCLPLSLNKPTALMSGGERQRLYLALFLSFKPKVLLLDEPTSALDATTGIDVLTNIIRFTKQEEITTIIISHDPRLVEHFHEQVIDLGGK